MPAFRSTLLAPAAALSVLLLGLTACGEEGGGGSGSAGLDSVEIAGDVGSAPEVDWDGELRVDELTTEVLVEGEGRTLEEGDRVLTNLWIGNGFTQDVAFSSFEDGGSPELITVNDDISPAIAAALEGQKVGSRVAVAAPPEDAFGETGNPQLGIGNDDHVLFVVDIASDVLDGPEGEAQKPVDGAPELVEEDGKPTGFDFSDAAKPGKKLQVITLVEGDGPAIEEGQTGAVDYLGQVFGKKKPFDQSYERGEPTAFPIGVGAVVKGWDQALVGATQGSRLLLVIPPSLGYGEEGNEGAGISGTDTLVFVVDVLGAA
ncbi:FKBP-type peptidyl-prolyl cis-trans isomerase [Nocardioides sp.]|uniref:FKBP-type peptidyl-prolyl cis-trans isomerase n=1 Tax=Nocardioides sp. TaxID=35761 RepID=UPI00273381B5|nr:FKBP-type peptidyl-prolyl cis-trans isomerase [Nocardioides sp.]MDP3889687.1 FKBP-type peptidyl-prolyl cis-trans isomerase [Nocardioides sp.]